MAKKIIFNEEQNPLKEKGFTIPEPKKEGPRKTGYTIPEPLPVKQPQKKEK